MLNIYSIQWFVKLNSSNLIFRPSKGNRRILTQKGNSPYSYRIPFHRNILCSTWDQQYYFDVEKLDGPTVGQSLEGWPKMYYLELLRASEGTLRRWSRLHLQSLAPTNPHWTRVVGYGPLCVIHTKDLCPSSGDINRLMMMNTMFTKSSQLAILWH
jgi:hypothetical protein